MNSIYCVRWEVRDKDGKVIKEDSEDQVSVDDILRGFTDAYSVSTCECEEITDTININIREIKQQD